MKTTIRFLFLAGFILISTDIFTFSQVAISTDDSNADPSSMLEVKSTNKGVLIPRMTHAQLSAIPSPANGLMVFCTDCGPGALAIFTDGKWNTFNATCLVPSSPSSAAHIAAGTQITWNWSDVQFATGYKWNTTNTYAGAEDLGSLTTKTETGLTCATPYTRYIWAYNSCGASNSTTLTQTTVTPAAPAAGTNVSSAFQVVWNWSSVPGASGYRWNTVNDAGSATDMGTVITKTESGLNCNTAYTRYVWAYNDCGNSIPVTLTQSTLSWTCGNPITINHIVGAIAPVNKTVTYGTVTNIPGESSKCWITSNLGADHQATAVNDATEPSAGWYWQFNRKQGFKHDGTTRTPSTTWIHPISENLDWQSANDPCALELGTGWRIPTATEWTNVKVSGGWTNWNVPWNSGLKLHAAGFVWWDNNGPLEMRGSYGDYWSSTQNSTLINLGWHLLIHNDAEPGANPNWYKSHGFTLRCLRDEQTLDPPTVATTSITNILLTTATSGGNVTADGGPSVTIRGVCWSTSSGPTTANSHTIDGSGTGTFSSSMTGLTGGTLYYVQAYATNSVGTAYGNELTFTTLTLPTVTTAAVTNITQTTAASGGNVTSDGGTPVTAKGVCWSTSSAPNIGGSHTIDGSGTGTFTSSLTSLTEGTLYYVRAYAINSAGTAYGNETSFSTYKTDAITDIEGNYYNIVTIGTQTWIAENLKATKFNDDTSIPLVTDATAWVNLTTPGYCWYDNDEATYKGTYGALYNWFTVNAGKLCPTGWHVPTDGEWTILSTYLGGESVAGGPLKETGNTHWNSPNSGATNTTGFTGLPGGYRYYTNGVFGGIGNHGNFWTTTEYDATRAWFRDLQYNFTTLYRELPAKVHGLYVRCVKDMQPTMTTTAATNILQTAATSGGNVTSDGGATVTARGVCWSTSSNPTTADNHTTDGSGTGTFVSSITGLTANTPHYVRAYATNSAGTAYGNEVNFTTAATLPTVSTDAVSAITSYSGISGGNVTSDGGESVTARGVCWSTSSNPTTADSHTTDGSGTGEFMSNLTGLLENTLYYVRAYAINSVETAYGNEVSFTTLTWSCGDPITDSRDGKTYITVQIGTQCWLKENLNIGIRIDGATYQSNNSIFEKHCYNNNEDSCNVYGGLYQWNETMQYVTTEGAQGVCPSGYHIPTATEWNVLSDYLGGETIAGGKMKEVGTRYWETPNMGASNSSGFSDRGAGTFRHTPYNYFYLLRQSGIFWTSTMNGSFAWRRDTDYLGTGLGPYSCEKDESFSVRCIKDL